MFSADVKTSLTSTALHTSTMASILPSISTAAELKARLDDGSTTLVCIDIEGDHYNTSEIGLAICSRFAPWKAGNSYTSFIEENQVSCSTIRIQKPTFQHLRSQEPLRFGDESYSIDDNFQSTISGNSQFRNATNLILVVFDSRAELKWASQSCPDLLGNFAAYVDVQKLAANASDNANPGLRQSLHALGLTEGVPLWKDRQFKIPHRAANDVVYTLAVLASLLSRPSTAATLKIERSPKPRRLFYGRPRPSRYYPYTVLIRTLDQTPLPSELDTAGKVHRYFSSFNPTSAGTGLTHKDSSQKEKLSRSWITFGSRAHLDIFCSSVNHTTVGGGKKIIIESFFIPGITLTSEERKAKQLEDGERIREERRKVRLSSDAPV